MNHNKKNQDEIIGERVTEEDILWLEMGKSVVKDAVHRVEEAAKQLISITSALQAIYFAAISFSDLKKAFVMQDLYGWILVALFVLPIVIWLISLAFAVNVLVPVRREMIYNSPDNMKNVYLGIINDKYLHLKYAHWALILGFIPLIINVIVYLVWIQVPK